MKKLMINSCLEQIQKLIFMSMVGFFSFIYPRKKKGQKKIGYLMSFPQNDNGLLLKMIKEMSDTKIILFYTKNCTVEAKFFSDMGIEIQSLEKSSLFFRVVIFKLCQPKLLICDNYYAFLGTLKLDKNTKVIQMWHANGAIKCFGWGDNQTNSRTWLDKRRFSKVYHRFDEYIVGSKRMGAVFERSYNAKRVQIKYLGYPRTDHFLNKERIEINKNTIYKNHPDLKKKKIMLYAPTYRLTENQVPLDINQLATEFSEEYFLVIKAHPHTVKLLVESTQIDFYYHPLTTYRMEELLSITDCLITDYSSIPFDYSLIRPTGKIIFFWYDYLEQKKKIGIQPDFYEWNPGTVVFTMKKLIETIHEERPINLTNFNQEWNQYNDGNATLRVVNYFKKIMY